MHALCQHNIVLIVVDALRPDHLSCYGYRRETTPEIDRIAQEGCRFENVISQSSWTKPAVASLLSGTLPEMHGVKSITDVLIETDGYLPRLLKQVGYTTCCIQTNPFLGRESGFSQGFDCYRELFENGSGECKPRVPDVYAAAAEWLECCGSRPFFLYLHLLDTHNPYTPPDHLPSFGSTEQDRYDGEIRFIDSYIGLLRNLLIRKGWYEKTLLIITADHGEEFEEHGRRYHAKHLYQEVLRVPLIITAPGILTSGVRSSSLTSSIDIVPTILELACLQPADTHQGSSVFPELNGCPVPQRPALSQIGSGKESNSIDLVSLICGEYKLIWNTCSQSSELYNLVLDPLEQHNLAEHEPAVVERLLPQIHDLLHQQKEDPVVQHRKRKEAPRIAVFEKEILQQLRGLGYID